MEMKQQKVKRKKSEIKRVIEQREQELAFLKEEIKLREDALVIQCKYPSILNDKATFDYEVQEEYNAQRIKEFEFNHAKKMFELNLQIINHNSVLSELKQELRE